jgi:WD40 repeat protein
MKVWNIAAGTNQTFTEIGITSLAVLPDGRVVSGAKKTEDYYTRVTVHNIDTGTRQYINGHTDDVLSVAVLSDGRIVTGSASTLKVWDLNDYVSNYDTTFHNSFQTHSRVNSVDVSGDSVVTGLANGNVKVYGVLQCPHTLVGHGDRVTDIAVLSNGNIVSGSLDRTIRVWNLAVGTHYSIQMQGEVNSVDVFGYSVVSGLSKGSVVGTITGSVELFDLFESLHTLEGHTDRIISVAVFPDGRIVSGSRDKTVKVWNKDLSGDHQTLTGHIDTVMSVAVMPDGRVVSGSWDRSAKVWDLDAGTHQTVNYGFAAIKGI